MLWGSGDKSHYSVVRLPIDGCIGAGINPIDGAQRRKLEAAEATERSSRSLTPFERGLDSHYRR
jgi:hypothetical protein